MDDHLSREVDTERNKAASCRDLYQEAGTLNESQNMWQHDKERARTRKSKVHDLTPDVTAAFIAP